MYKILKFRYVLKNKLNSTIKLMYLTIEDIENGALVPFKNNPETWEIIARDRFTEIEDKNKKEIYENDIIHEKNWWWGSGYVFFNRGHVGPVKSPCATSWIISHSIEEPKSRLTYNLWDTNKIEVLGNIYENPEKLNYVDESYF